jgi:hypothetical protein
LTASREYALEHPDSLMYADVTEEQVAWRLLKLCEVGMAAVVIEPIPPARSLH